jgi:hypothetical protein
MNFHEKSYDLYKKLFLDLKTAFFAEKGRKVVVI